MTLVPPIRLILASASPRRQQLLRQIGYEPLCFPVDVDESPLPEETPIALVSRLANLKAGRYLELLAQSTESPGQGESLIVLGADTVIDLDGQVLGKPEDRGCALGMLQRLSGREHSVVSGVSCLRVNSANPTQILDRQHVALRTQVQFGDISREDAEAYWNSGEPMGKAGGYAIQGIGARFVAGLCGSYSNVKGLPLYETHRLLRSMGLSMDHCHVTGSAISG